MAQRRDMKIRDWTLPVCTVTGLALLSVWSDLVGHGSGFFASADAVQEIANARVPVSYTHLRAFYKLSKPMCTSCAEHIAVAYECRPPHVFVKNVSIIF